MTIQFKPFVLLSLKIPTDDDQSNAKIAIYKRLWCITDCSATALNPTMWSEKATDKDDDDLCRPHGEDAMLTYDKKTIVEHVAWSW